MCRPRPTTRAIASPCNLSALIPGLEGTFLTVDQLVNGAWTAVRSDSHPSTIYEWNRTNTFTGTSTVNITWTIEDGTPSKSPAPPVPSAVNALLTCAPASPGGTYRISYFGDSKPLIGAISSFTGRSSNFTVA
ncbi:hypothetical protein EVG20_g8190 [Dentipellis fragilis]|uniref:Neutral/alkaline non-lysosomal ceramidase C-terminal domain-containing protein n=1 Tax=Dentipellis fragilis TaxID=205917 RepID=A0A4Y9YBV2_9AGAM|nr:hypothetical protein EVG20_g8190 [Dentipellis fragilis]